MSRGGFKQLAVSSLTAALVACSVPVGVYTQSSTGPGVPRVVTREFAPPNSYLGPIPTLVLLMKPYDDARSRAACDAFSKLPDVATGLGAQNGTLNALPLRMPITVESLPANATCDMILPRYDYFRAGRAMEQLASATADKTDAPPDFSGPGPFILEEYASPSGVGIIIIDLSSEDPSSAFPKIAERLASAFASQVMALAGKPIAGTFLASQDESSSSAASSSGSGWPGWLGTVIATGKGLLTATCRALEDNFFKLLVAGMEAALPTGLTKAVDFVASNGCKAATRASSAASAAALGASSAAASGAAARKGRKP